MSRLPALALLLFAPVLGPRAWDFPRDHGAHPAFQTEWWYYTGHLKTEDGRSYGYEMVFFRHQPDRPADLPAGYGDWRPTTLYPAHFAITDEDGGSFHDWQRLGRGLGGTSGADTARLAVHCGTWSARARGSAHRLIASADGFGIDLDLVPVKPVVLNGPGGMSTKGPEPGQASYYYSLTRLVTTGHITTDRGDALVRGVSWMDHEFFTAPLDSSLSGWDWFSLQLDDDTEVMLYRLRGRAGEADHVSGTFVPAEGPPVPLGPGGFSLEATAHWTSPATKITYPSAWRIRVPGRDLTLVVTPTVADQELDTRKTTGVIYWEGSVGIRGMHGTTPVAGAGYAELTGYN